MDERTLADLETLTGLRDRGVITGPEFEGAKARLMGSVPLAAPDIPEALPADRFDLLSELSRSDSATVWKARDRVSGQLTAVKMANAGADPVVFAEAAAAGRRLVSPAIVRVLGAGTRDGSPFLAMEYVEGQSLRSYLRARGRLGWQEAFPIADQLLQALETAHEAGVAHGRLEPGAVLVAATGGIKVTGFGMHAGPADAAPGPYTAPEGPGRPAADLYAAGAVVYEMVAGHPAAPGAQYATDIPPEARPFLTAALDPDPARRPATADAARMLLLTSAPSAHAATAAGAAPGVAWGAPPPAGPPPAHPGESAAPPAPAYAPPGYGPAAGYGPPPGWGAPPDYGPPPGWGAPPVTYPGYYGPYPGAAAGDDDRAALRARGLVFKAYPVWVVVLANIVTIGIFAPFWLAHWHGLMPKRRPNDPGTGRAIGFMFIPVFSIYWLFECNLRLCTRLDEELRTAGEQLMTPREVLRWGLVLWVGASAVFYAVSLAGAEETPAASVVMFVLMGGWVLLTVATGILQSRVNTLAAYDRSRGGVPR